MSINCLIRHSKSQKVFQNMSLARVSTGSVTIPKYSFGCDMLTLCQWWSSVGQPLVNLLATQQRYTQWTKVTSVSPIRRCERRGYVCGKVKAREELQQCSLVRHPRVREYVRKNWQFLSSMRQCAQMCTTLLMVGGPPRFPAGAPPTSHASNSIARHTIFVGSDGGSIIGTAIRVF